LVRRCLDWDRALPVLSDELVTLRELAVSDAASLIAHLGTPAVVRYIAPPPMTIEGFQQFIKWARLERRRRAQMCFGIVPASEKRPVGLIQLRPRDVTFNTAEWGFAICETAWGSGLFVDAAKLLLDFAFDRLGLMRLEARALEANGRGNGVLRKLGSTREGVLRNSFRDGDRCLDDVMWSLLKEEWEARRDNDEFLGASSPRTSAPALVRH
jgi:ribosomal-protein-alanine N-acetyltransferase